MIAPRGEPISELPLGETESWIPARVVSVASRLAVLDPNRLDLAIHVRANASLDAEPTLRLEGLGDSVSTTRFRDAIAIILRRPRNEGALMSLVVDPFEGRVLEGPTDILPSDRDTAHDAAADDEGATIGVCFGAQSADRGELRFVLLGPDGRRLGRSVRVAAGYQSPPWCQVASAGRDRYVVAWTNSPLFVQPRVHAALVHVRR